MKKNKEDTEQTKEAIMAAALTVFSHKGYAAAKIEDVAREAGVSRGAIYWHYKNKIILYRSLLDMSFGRVDHVCNVIMDSDKPPIAKLYDMMFNYFIILADDATMKSYETLSLLSSTVHESVDTAEAESELEFKYVSIMRKHVADTIRDGVASGEIRTDVDPDVLATSFFSYFNGVAETWVRNPESFPLKEFAPNLVRILLDGIRKR